MAALKWLESSSFCDECAIIIDYLKYCRFFKESYSRAKNAH